MTERKDLATSNPYDPKAAVAKTGRPREVVNAAQRLLGQFLRAPLERALAAALSVGTKRHFTDDEIKAWRRDLRLRARYGRGYLKRLRRQHGSRPHDGPRAIARRQRQIARDLICPLYSVTGERIR